jgi:hypothetical protein
MLENYTITNFNSKFVINCNRCDNEMVTDKITDNIIDIHNSYDMIVQFLLLNGFCINKYSKCLLFNDILNITISIYIDVYLVNYDNRNMDYQYFNNSSELLDYLKEVLDVNFTNKIAKNE